MARTPFYQRVRALGVRVNRLLSERRTPSEIRRATLIAYGLTLVISVLLLAAPLTRKIPRLEPGSIVQTDLKAQMDLRILDIPETERLKSAAYKGERPAFDRDAAVHEKIFRQLKTDMSWIVRTIRENRALPRARQVALLRERMPYLKDRIYAEKELLELIGEKHIAAIEHRASDILEKVYSETGFLAASISESVYRETLEKGAQIRTINSPKESPDVVWAGDQLLSPSAIKLMIRNGALKDNELSQSTMRILNTRVWQMIRENPYLSYNAQYTELRRRLAADRVTPFTNLLPRGTIFLRAGDVIDAPRQALIEQVRDNHRRRNGLQFLGIFLVMGVLAISVAYFTFRFAQKQMNEYGSHVILHLLFWTMFLIELATLRANPLKADEINFVLFVPFGFFGILIGQFFGARIALSAGIYLAIFSFILAGFDNQSLMVALTSAIAGLYASTRMEKRSQMFKGGLIIAVANLAVVLGFELMAASSKSYELKILAVIVSSTLSILLALGVLPFIEFAFNLPTPFRLMELNDFNHPLLTRMAAIAPSTHSHSVMLANLSEAAVRALGGDTLLTRVGCLYHDIGKMAHPEFYAENRHLYPTSEAFKKMGPLKSAQMITRHVTDGIHVARENRLPEKVISFIPEHHGTTTIQYFYHKALETARQGETIQRRLFQYPGPKPQSRETAVAMIADSVEAASRTAAHASREEFAEIIERIVQNKISEEQFHDAPLTLGDLAVVRKAFLEVLVSTYHERPHYPTMRETEALEEKSRNKKLREVSVRREKKNKSTVRKPELID